MTSSTRLVWDAMGAPIGDTRTSDRTRNDNALNNDATNNAARSENTRGDDRSSRKPGRDNAHSHNPSSDRSRGTGVRGRLVVATLTGALASASAVALLGFSAWLIARASEMPPVLSLSVAAVMVRAFALGRAVFRYAERIIGHDAAFRGLTSLRVAVYDGLERMTPKGVAQFARGDLLARLVADVDATLDLPLRVVLPWAQAVLVTLGTVVALVVILPGSGALTGVLALLAIVAVPALAAALAARFERRIAPARSALSATILTSLTAVADLVALGRVASVRARIEAQDADVTAAVRRESTSVGVAAALMTVLMGLSVTGALVIGTPAVREGRLAPVMLAVVALLPLALFDVLSTLPSAALAFQRTRGSTDRIAEVVTAPRAVADPAQPSELWKSTAWADERPAAGALRLRGVCAGWTDQDVVATRGKSAKVGFTRLEPTAQCGDVIHDIDLDVPAGGRLTVVGPSGAGKSTLAAVLMRFVEYRGSVTLDDIELRDCTGDDVREHITMLDQSPHLFDTSVAENVRLGRAGIDDDALWRTLDAVGLGEWVRGLPRGIDEPVGQLGTAVSGGQAQRIAVARLLVGVSANRPQVIVVDEPTEHLDVTSAALVQTAIDRLSSGHTLVTITHRLAGIADDEPVVVIADGRVVERGTARDLAAGDGWFAEQRRQELLDADLLAWVTTLPVGIGVPRTNAHPAATRRGGAPADEAGSSGARGAGQWAVLGRRRGCGRP